ncbi:Por secretion system C-terminal sorting domain-containing protein [Flavobacterium fluvii]|uniref:Por secretion system C-terminal sorting domain-containing protein n=1 Tax=Flavobacterium fluvii TaxID=468056 RepID=A0A1M5IDZ5_9FLAO|nr:T9SS type A sorting domain-containing protein [Flavobacterium fluvii]SHG26120.1 Por secretion system C-terminal sorting domain-containing protein [Flavobacterium fluvii]
MKSKILSKIFLIVVGFLFQFQANSQDMFVKSNSYVYVNNQYVYVKNDIELNASTSNFYLRNGGQLLQGTTGAGANKGIGSLSVFQEGTVNNYQYNYWCSPVGNVDAATTVNNTFGIKLLGRAATATATTPATILGSTSYDGTASPLAIAPYWVYKFINKSGYSDWIQVGSTTTVAPGEGFTMKGSSGTDATTVDGVQNNPDGKHQRYDFRGKPNDGTINIPVLLGEWTLTGNPYPSAINLQAFLLGEVNCTGTAYFWEQDKMVNSHYVADYKGGYGTYTAANAYVPAVFFTYDGLGNEVSNIGSSGKSYERRYSPIGQAFLVEGLANGNVQMKNSYRVFVKEGAGNESEFERIKNDKNKKSAADPSPQIRFNTVLDNGPISQMVLIFDPASTDGVDRALDGASPNDGPANNYFVLNNSEYVINVLPFNIDKKIPIGFRNYAQANYKITVNQMLNIPEVSNVYLHDKTTNIYYDIKNSFYDLTLPAGTYNTRYEITFKNGTLGTEDMESQRFLVQQDNVNKNLTINNPKQSELVSCNLYDVVGRLIFSKDKLGTNSSYSFSTANLSNGVYIVKLTANDKSEMGTKIIIKN